MQKQQQSEGNYLGQNQISDKNPQNFRESSGKQRSAKTQNPDLKINDRAVHPNDQ